MVKAPGHIFFMSRFRASLIRPVFLNRYTVGAFEAYAFCALSFH